MIPRPAAFPLRTSKALHRVASAALAEVVPDVLAEARELGQLRGRIEAAGGRVVEIRALLSDLEGRHGR